MSYDKHLWQLVRDFVGRFNDHRSENFFPSDILCADESMSKWNGLGGFWINIGLPQFVAMDRKPVDGCEIQNICCARSRVMLRLKLVEAAEEEDAHTQDDDEGFPHGFKVLRFLSSPWAHTDRLICSDSYFASVTAVEELEKLGLRFIGVVKTATKKFPMAYLDSIDLEGRGD